MEELVVNFRENRNSFEDIKDIETVCLFGNPDEIQNPLITICIPTYKRPNLLKRAIDSVLSQKTEMPFLVFVIDNEDDFSETETSKLIQSYKDNRLVYYKNKKNLGMGGNWNRCGELVKTDYFALLHDDDALLPSYIENIKHFIQKKKYDIVFSGYVQDGNPFSNNVIKKSNIIKKLFKKMLYHETTNISFSDILFLDNICGAPTCGVLFRKSTFFESGGFDSNYYPCLDWFFFIYALTKYKCVKYNKKCGIYYWEQNASLKEDVLLGFMKQREIVINSLIKLNFPCVLYYLLLKKDFINKKRTRLEVPFYNSSFIYKLISHLKVLKYRFEE